jgi:hypothetical protein
VAGRVVDSRTGAGIDGASLMTTLGIEATADQGIYVMLHPSGIFSIQAGASGYIAVSQSVTVGAGGSTEVNMALDNGTQQSLCFLKKALGRESRQLQVLQRFRDSVLGKSAQGKRYIRLYYLHSPEILAMMQKDAELAGEIYRCTTGLLPLMEQLMQGAPAVPDDGQRRLLTACLEKIWAHAQPGLRAETESVLKMLEKQQPLNSLLR